MGSGLEPASSRCGAALIVQAWPVSRQMAILTFEGPTVLYVHASTSNAEGYFEAMDVENDEYVFFGDDGTVVQPSVRGGRVVLTPTEEKRLEELRERLRTYVSQATVEMDPALADDTVALAALLLERERADGRSGWLARLLTRLRRET